MTPAFVNRKKAAELLSMSVDTFDGMRRSWPGFPEPAFHHQGRPFWKWAEIENHLAPPREPQEDDGSPSPFQKALSHAKGSHRARP